MSFSDTIRILLGRDAGSEPLTPEEWKRIAARVAWVRETTAKWGEAQRAMDACCSEAAGRLDEAAFNRLFDAEQAKVDAIRAQLQAVAGHDEWPRELHFKAI